MAGLRLGGERTEPRPDRRLGIKLVDPTADPASAKRLGGKLSAYVPPGAQYEYKPPSVFARYRALTMVFVVLVLGLLSYWIWGLNAPVPPSRAPSARAAAAPAAPAAAPAQDGTVYIEPLPPK